MAGRIYDARDGGFPHGGKKSLSFFSFDRVRHRDLTSFSNKTSKKERASLVARATKFCICVAACIVVMSGEI